MAIKRYTPKYKKLNRLRQAFWFEKKGKIKSFKKQKWSGLKRFYYPRSYQFYNQDKSAYSMSRDLEDQKSIRMKKTYKFLLMDKQRLQLFYGGGRFRHYQLKMLVKEALRRSVTTGATPAKAMLSLIENRTQTLLYRLGFVSSLMEARRFIQSGHLEISNRIIKNCSHELKQLDLLRFDPAKVQAIVANYLKHTSLVFYFRKRLIRRRLLVKKQHTYTNSLVSNNAFHFLNSFRVSVNLLKAQSKN